jgi:hypothetical protein
MPSEQAISDDALDLDLGSAPSHPHLVGQRQQLVQSILGQPQHPLHLVLIQARTELQDLLAGLGQDVRHQDAPSVGST